MRLKILEYKVSQFQDFQDKWGKVADIFFCKAMAGRSVEYTWMYSAQNSGLFPQQAALIGALLDLEKYTAILSPAGRVIQYKDSPTTELIVC
ncbi:hypothetical protein FKM82_008300 [Ascaphus truei]